MGGAFDRRAPTLVTDATRQTPDLAARLGTTSALLVPLTRGGERLGLLAVGFAAPPAASDIGETLEAGDAFVTALELMRLRQGVDLQRDVRDLLGEFSASLSAT